MERVIQLGEGRVQLLPPEGATQEAFLVAIRLTSALYDVLAGSEVDELRDHIALEISKGEARGREAAATICDTWGGLYEAERLWRIEKQMDHVKQVADRASTYLQAATYIRTQQLPARPLRDYLPAEVKSVDPKTQ